MPTLIEPPGENLPGAAYKTALEWLAARDARVYFFGEAYVLEVDNISQTYQARDGWIEAVGEFRAHIERAQRGE